MSIRTWFQGLFRKDSQVRTIIAMDTAGRPAGTQHNYKSYAEEGYALNVIAFRCVNMIASAVSRIPLCVYQETAKGEPEEVHDHPFKVLMRKPNPMQSWQKMVHAAMSYYLVDGNEYLELVNPTNSQLMPPMEIWAQQPDFFKIIPGMNGLPASYEARVGSRTRSWPVDIMGRSNILHLKMFNPLDPWYGLSPMKTAAYNIDQLNEADKWNFGLLRNSARPSLAITIKSEAGNPGTMTENQRQQLRNDIDAMHTGSRNSGRPMLLEGGVEVTPLSFNPKDMEFPGIKKLSQKDVALVYGVPGQLVGVEGSMTFANMEEAKLQFYLDTVIPLAEDWVAALNADVMPRYGKDNVYLGLDLDRVQALAPIRDKLWARAKDATHLTTNEKRALTDYGRYEVDEELEDREPGDVILVPTMVQPLETAAGPALAEEPDASDYEETPNQPPDDGDDGDVDPDAGDGDEDTEPEDDGTGSKSVKSQLQLINLRSKIAKAAAAKALDAIRERHENKMAKEVYLVFQKQKKMLKAAFSKHVSHELVDFVVHSTLAKSDSQLHAIFTSNLRQVCEDVGRPLLSQGKSFKQFETKDADSVWEHAMDIYIENEAGNNITRVQGTTKKKVTATIREAMADAQEDGEGPVFVADALAEEFDSMSASRAMTIARTETHNAASYATRKAAEALKIPNMTKEWVPVQDKRTRDGHAEMSDYGPIELHEKFQVEGDDGTDDMDGPGDQSASAGNLINCRCALVFDTGSDGGE